MPYIIVMHRAFKNESPKILAHMIELKCAPKDFWINGDI